MIDGDVPFYAKILATPTRAFNEFLYEFLRIFLTIIFARLVRPMNVLQLCR